jgi:hypothetical protein
VPVSAVKERNSGRGQDQARAHSPWLFLIKPRRQQQDHRVNFQASQEQVQDEDPLAKGGNPGVIVGGPCRAAAGAAVKEVTISTPVEAWFMVEIKRCY